MTYFFETYTGRRYKISRASYLNELINMGARVLHSGPLFTVLTRRLNPTR